MIHLRRSKNDPEAAGRSVVLVPRERKEICPVRAMREWTDAAHLTKGALYRSVDRHVSACLNPDSIPRILKWAAARTGLSASAIARIAAHSLRAGLVTQSSLNGVSPLTVAEMTGHRTLSVVKQYCRTAEAIGAASTIASGLRFLTPPLGLKRRNAIRHIVPTSPSRLDGSCTHTSGELVVPRECEDERGVAGWH